MPAMSRRSRSLSASIKKAATLVAGLAIAAAPLAATPAQADSGTGDFQVTVSARNDSNLSFQPAPPHWFKIFETEFDEEGLTIAPAADGTFNLTNSSGCVEEQSGSQLHMPSSCPTSGAWALQRANDGSDYFLIRHVIDDKCLTPAEVSRAGNVVLDSCDSGDTEQHWSLTPRGDTSETAVDDLVTQYESGTIGSEPNKVQVCNNGGYAARATVDYTVQEPSSTDVKTGHIALPSFPVGQCQTATLPAGKVAAVVQVYRFTNWYAGRYAFWDGDRDSNGNCVAFAGCDNDRPIAKWSVAGTHADVTFSATGTTCYPGLSISKSDKNTALDGQIGDTDRGCTGSTLGDITSAFSGGVPKENTSTAYTVGEVVINAFTFITKLFGGAR
ncbi:RICIN domain-containing protein [Streptomyces cucumeris]|uniref:RICIN domain-containing protein n=1 Tax=Streptomyces cucumeris TaxID=2962890 RepID=UPI003D7213D6